MLSTQVIRERLTVMNETVAWDMSGKRDPYNCIDIDPCEVFTVPMVKDPLDAEYIRKGNSSVEIGGIALSYFFARLFSKICVIS